jgi:hypothetical protein
MADRRHPVGTVQVERFELDGGDPPREASSPLDAGDRRPPWRALAAVAGALVVGVVAVAIIEPGSHDAGSPSTPAPTTTVPGPIRVASIDDLRALAPTPAAQSTLVSMNVVPEVQPTSAAASVLYLSAGASADAGTWLLLQVDDNPPLLPFDAGFVRPPRATFIGEAPGAVGRGLAGDETTVFDHLGGRVTVIGHGLLPGQTESIARNLEIEDGVAKVPDDQVPSGLHRQQTRYIPAGMDFVHVPVQPRDRRDASYTLTDGGTVDVAVSAIEPDQAAAVVPTASFFLDDVTPVVVRGNIGTTGTQGDRRWLVWSEGRHLVSLGATGVGRDALVAFAADLRLATDRDWDEAAWSNAVVVAGESEARRAEEASAAPVTRIVDRGSLRGDVSWWDIGAVVDGDDLAWTLRTGENTVPGDTWTTDAGAPFRTPFALETNGRQIYNTDPVAADAHELSTWYAGAIVVVDPSLAGSVLRLTTDGPNVTIIETTVHPVVGVEGHLLAGAALRWTDHYTAELIGPDGTRLAVSTDADPT